MNKTPRLSKSSIEYLDYAWGIFSGCRNQQDNICHVKRCWAKGIALHFPKLYPNGFKPTFYPEAIDSPTHIKKPSRIGVGWVGDVIGYGIEYKEQIYATIKQCPRHTFLFLTKNPESLIEWNPFPPNCFVGVTATGPKMFVDALAGLRQIEARVKYISIEPYLIKIPSRLIEDYGYGLDWLIWGQQTPISVKTQPKIEWLEEIELVARKADIPIFEKNNLFPLLQRELIQELPK